MDVPLVRTPEGCLRNCCGTNQLQRTRVASIPSIYSIYSIHLSHFARPAQTMTTNCTSGSSRTTKVTTRMVERCEGQRGVSSCLTAFRRLQSDAFSFRASTGPSVEAVVTAADWKGAFCATAKFMCLRHGPASGWLGGHELY